MDLEEVKKYLVHFQTYKDEKSFEVLLENYRIFLHFFAHKLSNLPLDKAELESTILFSFYSALVNYDYQKYSMAALTTYIWKTILNNVLNEARNLKRKKEVLTLDEVVSHENNTTKADLIAGMNEEDIFKLATINYNKNVINEMLQCLTKKQQEIIKYRYGVCGYPYKKVEEISSMFNCSRQYIYNCERDSLMKMRKLYNDKYHDLV